jgi:hypothetical protein
MRQNTGAIQRIAFEEADIEIGENIPPFSSDASYPFNTQDDDSNKSKEENSSNDE